MHFKFKFPKQQEHLFLLLVTKPKAVIFFSILTFLCVFVLPARLTLDRESSGEPENLFLEQTSLTYLFLVVRRSEGYLEGFKGLLRNIWCWNMSASSWSKPFSEVVQKAVVQFFFRIISSILCSSSLTVWSVTLCLKGKFMQLLISQKCDKTNRVLIIGCISYYHITFNTFPTCRGTLVGLSNLVVTGYCWTRSNPINLVNCLDRFLWNRKVSSLRRNRYIARESGRS